MANDKVRKPTKEEQEELDKLLEEIVSDAKDMIDDYVKNPSELNKDNLLQVHEDSPLFDEYIKGNKWQRVVKNIPGLEDYLKGYTKKMEKVFKKNKKKS